MKLRNGFVSNSSSSSFTCDVCNGTESGWDLCMSEAEMSECKNGHIFCNDHKKTVGEPSITEQRAEMILDNEKKYVDATDAEITEAFKSQEWDDGGNGEYSCMPFYCPICNMSDIPDRDLIKYLLQGRDLTRKEVVAEIKKSYDDYKTFAESIK